MRGGDNRLVTAQEVGELLGVPARQVIENRDRWRLPWYRIGKHVRFRLRDVENWLERREHAA